MQLPKDTSKYSYDDWLDFFGTCTADALKEYEDSLTTEIPAEGYAALKRWLEILDSPSKMDKLHQSRLKAKQDKNVMKLAVGDDDEAFYEALITENVEQLSSGKVSPQEVARLSQNINIFRRELREVRSRKPKSGTKLDEVLKRISGSEKPGPESTNKASKKAKTMSKPSRRKSG